jgi:uncharacterized protein
MSESTLAEAPSAARPGELQETRAGGDAPTDAPPEPSAVPEPSAIPEPDEPAPAPVAMAPVRAGERIEFIDVLRGLALFGILTANMRGHNAPAAMYGSNGLIFQGFGDRLAQALIDIFVSGKFITLFAWLFGLGFAVQMTRADARGVKASSFYPRRLLALLAFGVIHGALIWWGDILVAYSVMGFILLAFHKRSSATALKWVAGVWTGVMVLLLTAVVAVSVLPPENPSPNARRSLAELQRVIEVYQSGSPAGIMSENVQAWLIYLSKDMSVLMFLPIFLLGLLVWRQGIVQDLAGHRELLARVCRVALPLGLLLEALARHADLFYLARNPRDPVWLPATVFGFYGTPVLSLGYASGLALLMLRPGWPQRLKPFAAVGRMALTNYLMQSVLCLALFVGTGWYGKVGPLLGLVPTVLLFAAQVAFSNWWLARHKYGPMEYVWRVLTYGRARADAAAAA